MCSVSWDDVADDLFGVDAGAVLRFILKGHGPEVVALCDQEGTPLINKLVLHAGWERGMLGRARILAAIQQLVEHGASLTGFDSFNNCQPQVFEHYAVMVMTAFACGRKQDLLWGPKELLLFVTHLIRVTDGLDMLFEEYFNIGLTTNVGLGALLQKLVSYGEMAKPYERILRLWRLAEVQRIGDMRLRRLLMRAFAPIGAYCVLEYLFGFTTDIVQHPPWKLVLASEEVSKGHPDSVEEARQIREWFQELAVANEEGVAAANPRVSEAADAPPELINSVTGTEPPAMAPPADAAATENDQRAIETAAHGSDLLNGGT